MQTSAGFQGLHGDGKGTEKKGNGAKKSLSHMTDHMVLGPVLQKNGVDLLTARHRFENP